MTPRHTVLAILLACCICLLPSCNQKKDVSGLSDEEKISIGLDDLSPSEKSQQIEARKNILDRFDSTQKADDILATAIENAREVLSEEDFKTLQEIQSVWNRQGKGEDVNKLVKSGMVPANAFAKSIQDRADWVSRHTSWAMLIDMPGTWGGLYHSIDGKLLEIYEMPDQTVSMVIRIANRPIIYTGTGRFDGETARIHPHDDPTIMVELNKIAEGKLELQCTPEFSHGVAASMKPLFEGLFTRYATGEFDPFSTGEFDVLAP